MYRLQTDTAGFHRGLSGCGGVEGGVGWEAVGRLSTGRAESKRDKCSTIVAMWLAHERVKRIGDQIGNMVAQGLLFLNPVAT